MITTAPDGPNASSSRNSSPLPHATENSASVSSSPSHKSGAIGYGAGVGAPVRIIPITSFLLATVMVILLL